MSCTRYQEGLSAHVDGETAGEERQVLETHLASCAACRERARGLRGLKHAVSQLQGRYHPSEAVSARVEGLRFRRGLPRWWARRSVGAGVVVAAALMGGGGAWLAYRAWGAEAQSVRGSLAEELIADHLKYVPEAMPAEVASQDSEHVRRFFQGKVPFDPIVPTLDGASLLGGRLCRIRGYYEQLLFYQRGSRKLSLYVSNERHASSSCSGSHGYFACDQDRNGLSLTLVGDAPESELRSLLNGSRL